MEAEPEMTQTAAAPQPECFIYQEMLRDAVAILADLQRERRQSAEPSNKAGSGEKQALCGVESLRILSRLNRVMMWIALEQDFRRGHSSPDDFRDTLASLFHFPGLQEEKAEITAALPAALQELARRSRSLLDRARRLRSYCTGEAAAD